MPVDAAADSFRSLAICFRGICRVLHVFLQAEGLEAGVDEAHMLCMVEAPAAREDVLALWAWLRLHLAVGLLESWAATPDFQARPSISVR